MCELYNHFKNYITSHSKAPIKGLCFIRLSTRPVNGFPQAGQFLFGFAEASGTGILKQKIMIFRAEPITNGYIRK